MSKFYIEDNGCGEIELKISKEHFYILQFLVQYGVKKVGNIKIYPHTIDNVKDLKSLIEAPEKFLEDGTHYAIPLKKFADKIINFNNWCSRFGF